MASSLLEENKQLRRQLKAYVAHAGENELKLRRFQQHELRFISASGVQDLLSALFIDYRRDFQLDALSLILIDPDHEVRRIMENLGITPGSHPDLLFTDDAESLDTFFNSHFHPRVGACQNACSSLLFPNNQPTPASMALFPLVRYGELIGALNIGSHQAQRYMQGIATDFLERLAAIVAVCLESAINSEKLKLLGLLDALTGVHNRRYFEQRLEEELGRSLREQLPLSCLFMDIDHFKQFNDTHGHHIGDLVLREVAGLIKRQMRRSDVMARYGGEEFVVLLVQTDTDEALEIAERIRQSIARHQARAADNQLLQITISIGCATLPPHFSGGLDAASQLLLTGADKALYASKEYGRNRVTYFDPTSQALRAEDGESASA